MAEEQVNDVVNEESGKETPATPPKMTMEKAIVEAKKEVDAKAGEDGKDPVKKEEPEKQPEEIKDDKTTGPKKQPANERIQGLTADRDSLKAELAEREAELKQFKDKQSQEDTAKLVEAEKINLDKLRKKLEDMDWDDEMINEYLGLISNLKSTAKELEAVKANLKEREEAELEKAQAESLNELVNDYNEIAKDYPALFKTVEGKKDEFMLNEDGMPVLKDQYEDAGQKLMDVIDVTKKEGLKLLFDQLAEQNKIQKKARERIQKESDLRKSKVESPESRKPNEQPQKHKTMETCMKEAMDEVGAK
jgi:hypothetical protein